MRVSVSEETAVPLERLWAWWTDYGKPGEDVVVSHPLGKSTRRILHADDHLVRFEERAMGVPFSVREVEILDHELEERSIKGLRFRSTWSFEATASGGSRVTREVEALIVARRPVADDLRHHLRECERELRG